MKKLIILIERAWITSCLKHASAKMNTIKRLGNFLSKNQKKILCYSYVPSYFKYFPIIQHFRNISNTHKIEKIHERVIRFIHSDYNTDYFTILINLNLRTLHANRLEKICIEISKIKKGPNPKYMNDSYHRKTLTTPIQTTLRSTYHEI